MRTVASLIALTLATAFLAFACGGDGEERLEDGAADGKIVFSSNPDGFQDGSLFEDIYVMNADGSGVTRLTDDPAGGSNPDWSPDGTRVAFSSYRDSGLEIYLINADGSGLMRLTDTPDYQGFSSGSPDWSPDGTRIAHSSSRGGNTGIYVINADGSGQMRLTEYDASDMSPAWSPDGTKIAFESGRLPRGIYVMNADGSDIRPLGDEPVTGHDPTWSPDGTRIAFLSSRDVGFFSDIYVMNADGSGVTQLTDDPARDVYPAWSPDGTRIAFLSNRDSIREDSQDGYLCANFSGDIYVMNADGSGVTRLTEESSCYGMGLDWSSVP